LSANFRGSGTSPTNDRWHQKTKVPGLSRVCVILRLTQYRCVTDRQTHRRMRTANNRVSIALRG